MNVIETVAEIERLEAKATKGDWFTVESPWRANYFDKDIGEYRRMPTYIVAGTPDPHGCKPVVDGIEIDEWGDEKEYNDFVDQSDADLELIAALRNACKTLCAAARDAERYRKALEEIQDFQSECRCPPEGCGCCEQGMKDIAFAALKGGA